MLKDYFNITLRILVNNKFFSFLNVFSLSIGMACCLLIFSFVQYELSFDQQFRDSDKIYRVQRDFFGSQGSDLKLATTAPLVGPLLKQEFAEIEDTTRLRIEQAPISKDDIVILEKYIGWVDNNFFEFFDFEFIYGDITKAFDGPTSVVLSQDAAIRYFGNRNPLGESLLLNGEAVLQVAGVYKDLPKNTHLKIDVLLSIDLVEDMMGEGQLESWGANSYFTYIKLPENYDIQRIEENLPGFLSKHYSDDANDYTALPIRKLSDIHLYSHAQNEIKPNGDIYVVTTFSVIAIFILLVACMNFMNLSTARSVRRAKEIGVRKASGAQVRQLICQFLFESVLLAIIAMFIAGILVEVTLPLFTRFLDSELDFSQLYNFSNLIYMMLFTFLVGILAGSYPAFYLSKFDPVNALKGRVLGAFSSGTIRKALVVFQFTISICLIIGTLVVYEQMKHAKNIDLGYDRMNNIVVDLPFDYPLWEGYLPFQSKLLSHPDITSVTLSSRYPTNQLLDGSLYFRSNSSLSDDSTISMRDVRIDYGFFEHYKIQLLAGRFFAEEFGDRNIVLPTEKHPNGKANIIINESALKILGFRTPAEAIGQEIVQPMDEAMTSFIRYPIIGVVKDFYFSSLHTKIQSVVFTPMIGSSNKSVSIKLGTDDPSSALVHLNTTWQDLFPEFAFTPLFLEEQYDNMYNGENKQVLLLTMFSLLTIVIAIMGLYGLASYSAEKRSKELSIRKVLGARVSEIIFLVSQEFINLLLISTFVAWPLAYWATSNWLGQFAYSITLDVWPFIYATFIALIITSVTTMVQTTKLAIGRPVKYLRYE